MNHKLFFFNYRVDTTQIVEIAFILSFKFLRANKRFYCNKRNIHFNLYFMYFKGRERPIGCFTCQIFTTATDGTTKIQEIRTRTGTP